jgi:hypothetical protein
MLVAVLLSVLVGLFVPAMEGFDARVLGPPDVHGARRNRDETDVDRQGSGRWIEGRDPWTDR